MSAAAVTIGPHLLIVAARATCASPTLATSIRATAAIARSVTQSVVSKNKDLSTSLEMTLLRGREAGSIVVDMILGNVWKC